LWLYPALFSSTWYKGAAWLIISSDDEIELSLLIAGSGIFFMIEGGWLDLALTYLGLSPGLVKGL